MLGFVVYFKYEQLGLPRNEIIQPSELALIFISTLAVFYTTVSMFPLCTSVRLFKCWKRLADAGLEIMFLSKKYTLN